MATFYHSEKACPQFSNCLFQSDNLVGPTVTRPVQEPLAVSFFDLSNSEYWFKTTSQSSSILFTNKMSMLQA